MHTVLVVDDEPQILASLRDLLEDDFSVQTTTDANSALQMLAEAEVNVILADQRMPGLTGDQFLSRAREISQATRVLITGYTDINALIKAVNHGQIYTYIAKPWDPIHLKITVRKAADHCRLAQQLLYERELLHELMDHTTDGIFFKDAGSRYLRINRAQARLLGIADPELAVGKTKMELLPGAESREAFKDDAEIVRSGRPLVDKLSRFRRADGQVRWITTTKVPVTDKNGKVNTIIGIARDVTERRSLEEQLRHAQKMEAVGRLAGGVAHDFNNTLTIISGYCELMLRQLEWNSPFRDHAERISAAAKHSAGLTRQLLTISRSQVIQPQSLDLNAVIANLQAILLPITKENIVATIRPAPDLGKVSADLTQIEQIILNLVVNACDAMPGGGSLLIETANVELQEADLSPEFEARPGRFVRISVQDTGAGMSPEILARIFDPFFTTKEKSKGTGLGLATVHGIVKQAGGCISVASEPGKGSTFHIVLPRLQEEVAVAPVAERPASSLHGSETVLVTEDRQEVRTLVRKGLSSYGYKVLEASDAAQALEVCQQTADRIDLLVTDLVMPGMDGRQLARQIQNIRPQIKVLFMSGYPAGGAGEPLPSGEAFLQKPFTPHVMARKVREILDTPSVRGSILVVDDDQEIRGLLRRILEDEGYHVSEVSNGRLAEEKLGDQAFDLMIVDLLMPEREGLETIRIVREAYPRVKIIAISGGFGANFLKVAQHLGAQAVLTKPLEVSRVVETIRQILLSGPKPPGA